MIGPTINTTGSDAPLKHVLIAGEHPPSVHSCYLQSGVSGMLWARYVDQCPSVHDYMHVGN